MQICAVNQELLMKTHFSISILYLNSKRAIGTPPYALKKFINGTSGSNLQSQIYIYINRILKTEVELVYCCAFLLPSKFVIIDTQSLYLVHLVCANIGPVNTVRLNLTIPHWRRVGLGLFASPSLR